MMGALSKLIKIVELKIIGALRTRANSSGIKSIHAQISVAFQTAASISSSKIKTPSVLGTIVKLCADAFVEIWKTTLMLICVFA